MILLLFWYDSSLRATGYGGIPAGCIASAPPHLFYVLLDLAFFPTLSREGLSTVCLHCLPPYLSSVERYSLSRDTAP